jgi:uncharacterized protein HemX
MSEEPIEKQKQEDNSPKEKKAPASTSTHEAKPQFILDKSVDSKAKPVILYIVVMFGVALFLIILSFFMQQRNHEALIKGLSTSAMNVQTIVDLEMDKQNLEEDLTEKSDQLEALTQEKKALEEEASAMTQQLKGLEWLLELQDLYESGKYSKAKELLAAMEKEGLDKALPTTSTLPDHPSPQNVYEVIKKALS